MKLNKILLPFAAIFLIVSGIILILAAESILRYIIRTNLVLVPGSQLAEAWNHIPTPVKMDFYFFNWTNPQDIYKKDVKPKVEQVGPYHFAMDLEKTNVSWNDNGTVTFQQKRTWLFRQESTNGSLQDVINLINVPSLGAAHLAASWNYLVRRGISITLSSLLTEIHVNRTVDEFLFKGYPDPLIALARKFPFMTDPEAPKLDRFGWFYKLNRSTHLNGVTNMGTGIGSTFAKVHSWNYSNKTKYYGGHCANVEGSTGDNFKLGHDQKTVKMFLPDVCRALTLEYVEDVSVGGILGKKFIVSDKALDNGTKYPENQCFCPGDCQPSGTFNVSSCRFGTPTFMSLPHFHRADSFYNTLVDGLQPNKDKHEFYFIIEPKTGIPLDVKVRLQINLYLHPVPAISIYENVPKVFFPTMWFTQQASVDGGDLYKIKLLLFVPTICKAVGIVLIVSGCLILITIMVFLKIKKKKLKVKKLEMEEELPLKPDILNVKFK